MRTFRCVCGNTLFFHSTQCLGCGRPVGWRPDDEFVAAIDDLRDGRPFINGQEVVRCQNGADLGVCNRYVAVRKPADRTARLICDWCSLTKGLPNLSFPENVERLRRMEFAKQRVLQTIHRIGLPIQAGPGELPLSFRFPLGSKQAPVITGHDNGVITIDLNEADPVHRETVRIDFGEPQRTLVGHFRHELGHYYWQRLVQPDAKRLAKYRTRFGDERTPGYELARNNYYAAGPRPWVGNYVSAYAAMHSWEDFAETFNAYLDMRAVLDTATHFKLEGVLYTEVDAKKRFDRMIQAYTKAGIIANELNRDLGLLDLVPEVFTRPVREKLRWVHQLCRRK